MKCFRIRVRWDDGYETHEYYYYRLGYKNLGKVIEEAINDGEEILEIVKLVSTFKAIRVCWKKTDSWYKGECNKY
jgi:hypothetical protein